MSFEREKVLGSVTVLINEYSFQAKLSFEDFFANHSLVGELSGLLSHSRLMKLRLRFKIIIDELDKK